MCRLSKLESQRHRRLLKNCHKKWTCHFSHTSWNLPTSTTINTGSAASSATAATRGWCICLVRCERCRHCDSQKKGFYCTDVKRLCSMIERDKQMHCVWTRLRTPLTFIIVTNFTTKFAWNSSWLRNLKFRSKFMTPHRWFWNALISLKIVDCDKMVSKFRSLLHSRKSGLIVNAILEVSIPCLKPNWVKMCQLVTLQDMISCEKVRDRF